MDNEIYKCDTCNVEIEWGSHSVHNGHIWYCESCGASFCTKCFEDATRVDMLEEEETLCATCYKKANED